MIERLLKRYSIVR